MPPDTVVLTTIAAISFAGALTQSAIGFGFAIVFAPLATLLVGAQSAVATSIVLSTVLSAALVVEARPRWAAGTVVPLAIVSTISTPLGIWVLARASESAVRLLVALAVLGGALVTLRSHPREEAHAGALPVAGAVGLLSGVLRGATSMGGPPVVLYLHRLGGGSSVIRDRLFTYFALSALTSIPLAWAGGVLGAQELHQSLTAIPLVLGGVAVGRLVRPRLSETMYRRGTLALLAVTSAVAIAQVLLARSSAG